MSPRSGFVALIGWTNVGKSTLLNRLVEAKLAAVADVAQTTRHRITGVRDLGERGQIAFVDTPGMHRPRYRMNRAMLEIARHAVHDVDVVAQVVDAAKGIGPGDRETAHVVTRAAAKSVLVLNKIDRVTRKSALLPMMQEATEELGFDEVVPVSALTGDGCERLLDVLHEALPEGPAMFPPDYLTDQTERTLAAEWVREKLLAETREELPHAAAVMVEHWNERDDGVVEIEAAILVDRDSQKKIVIGRQGALLKKIGTRARAELEELLERKVYLRLWVKVRGHWRENEGILKRLGVWDG